MCSNLQLSLGLVTFTEEVFNGNFHFLCSGTSGTLVVNGLFLGKIQYRKNIGNTGIWSKFCIKQVVGIKRI